MLDSVNLSNNELNMLKLMAKLVAEQNSVNVPCAITNTYSKQFKISKDEASKVLEELKKKIDEAEFIRFEVPNNGKKWSTITRQEADALKEMVKYCASTSEATSFKRDTSFKGLNDKIAKASCVECETLTPIVTTPNPYKAVLDLLQIAGDKLKLPAGILEILKHPMRTIILNIPVVMDDGTVRVFTGYRVQYNDALGPTKGGIRYHPDLTMDEVTALSAWMTWKTAVTGLPLGGGKGGIRCNPKEMSTGELERLTRGYARALAKYIGPYTDVPAPDVYTDGQTMAWIMDEYSQIVGWNSFGVVTGKPVCLGGSLGRNEATSRGVMYTVVEAAKHKGIDLKKATVAVQGYGNVGFHAARLLHELGCKIIAVSDSAGGIYHPDGIDPNKAFQCKNDNCSVTHFDNCKKITNKELLEVKCDILVPAALENQITKDNANKIKAKIVAEGANGPVTPDADEILFKNDIFVIPDILANAGGVIVSYFEQVQNQMNYYWSEEEVRNKLKNTITNAFNGVLAISEEYYVNMRVAAYMKALKRVSDAMIVRNPKAFSQ